MKERDEYIVIHSWMTKLFGKQYAKRDIYAAVYRFSRDIYSRWCGSLKTLSELTGHTRENCSKYLNELVNEDYLKKIEYPRGNEYYVNFDKIKENY